MAKVDVWMLTVSGFKQISGNYSLCVHKKKELISNGMAKENQCKIVPNK